MRVITIASSKGGVGKTTLASLLAVKAASISSQVCIVDLDPQGSLGSWWQRRGRPGNPALADAYDTASEAVGALRNDGWEWLIIDTPPAFVHVITDAIRAADLAVIPLKASALDLVASEDSVLAARDASVQHLCVITDAEPRWKTTNAARDYLRAAGVPVAETIITHRAAYVAAMTAGKAGPEVDRTDATQREIDSLWAEIVTALEAADV